METPKSETTAAGFSSLERMVSSLLERTEKLSVERVKLRLALQEVKDWYDRDGSVGGCSLVMETVEKALAANDLNSATGSAEKPLTGRGA